MKNGIDVRKMERGNSFSISRPTKFPKRMKTNTFLRRKTHLLKNSLEKNYPQNKKEEEPKPCTTTTQTTPLTYATMGQGLYKPLVFLPPHPSYDVRGNISLLTNQNTQDQIPFCLIRPSSASSSSSFSNWCVLYSHGNAEDLGQLEPLLTSLANTFQISTASYDYGGYGQASGESSEERCFSDAIAVYEHLREKEGFDPNKILLFGRSLGSGPTCHLAKHLETNHLPFAGVFLQSPIESAIRVVSRSISYCYWDMFHNYEKITAINKPIAIIHGTRDEVVPYEHGRNLHALCEEKGNSNFISVEGAGHNNIESRYWNVLETAFGIFLETVQKR